jgi:hypothetical protein
MIRSHSSGWSPDFRSSKRKPTMVDGCGSRAEAGNDHLLPTFDSAHTIFPLTLLTSKPVISAKTGFMSYKSASYVLIPIIVSA